LDRDPIPGTHWTGDVQLPVAEAVEQHAVAMALGTHPERPPRHAQPVAAAVARAQLEADGDEGRHAHDPRRDPAAPPYDQRLRANRLLVARPARLILGRGGG